MSSIFIYGAGGHGAVVMEIAASSGFTVAGFIDDDPRIKGLMILGLPILGGREVLPDNAQIALAIGGNAVRSDLLAKAREAGWHLPVLIHSNATVSQSAVISEGTVIIANAVVNSRAQIGAGSILNTACSVDHDCVLGEVTHIAPGSHLGGGVTVGNGSLVGIGASILPNIEVGRWCVVGAGAVVTSDVTDHAVVVGAPAKARSINTDYRD